MLKREPEKGSIFLEDMSRGVFLCCLTTWSPLSTTFGSIWINVFSFVICWENECKECWYILPVCSVYHKSQFDYSIRSVVFLCGFLSQPSETMNGSFGCDSCCGGKLISTTSDLLTGTFAFPDAGGFSLNTVFTAERWNVFSVLIHFEFLYDLS